MEKFNIRKSIIENTSTFITIDIGVSLLKCIYVSKENDNYNINSQNTDIIFTSQIINFTNGIEDFLINVKSRISNLECFQSKVIMLCGMQCQPFQLYISEQFMCEVKIVPEYEAMASGLRYIINNSENDSFFYLPEIIESTSNVNSEMLKKLLKAWKKKELLGNLNSGNENYPSLYVNVGSVSRYIVVNEIGEGKDISFYTFGGKTFQGLAKCLLDENNINELLNLAEVGNREHTDTQIKEVFIDAVGSPYGDYPPDLPVFAFGKAMDYSSNDQIQFRKEDISQSLVSMILENAVFFGIRIAAMSYCKKIYFGGNLFQHRSFRVEYSKFCRRLPETIKTYFLKGGIETNIGLLILNKEVN